MHWSCNKQLSEVKEKSRKRKASMDENVETESDQASENGKNNPLFTLN